MNLTPAFIRKVLYLAAMVPPLLVLVYIGMPDVHGGGKPSVMTGRLAQLRNEYHLSPANLGEIDPASETMRLSTLGLRGVAVNVLWNEADKYKKMRDFDKLSATVNQIVLLQPNFITVWEYQAHNLSYNVSVEFDDYRDRYSWVTKGINFLMSGTQYNLNEPRLMSQCGWFIGQKIGQADEYRQFRRLFRRDTDFHNEINRYVDVDEAKSRADFLPDNWLVARLWYKKAQRVVETRNSRTRESPWLFFSHGGRCLMSYAKALDRDGDLPPDDVSQQAWRTAGDSWAQFAQREFYVSGIPTRLALLKSRRDQQQVVLLGIVAAIAGLPDEQIEKLKSEAGSLMQGGDETEQAARELAASFPEFYRKWQEINEERRARLSENQLNALAVHPDVRNAVERRVAKEANKLLEIDPGDMLEQVPESRRGKYTRQFNDMMNELAAVEQLNTVTKFDYWRLRCEMEATAEAREAKRLLYEARKLREQARLTQTDSGEPGAKEVFEKAWDVWHKIFTKSPRMYENVEESQLLLHDLMLYDDVLSKLDEPPLPYDFKLRRLVDNDESSWNGRALQPRPRGVTAPRNLKGDGKASEPPGETTPGETTPSEAPPAKEKPAAEKKPAETPAAETPPTKASEAAEGKSPEATSAEGKASEAKPSEAAKPDAPKTDANQSEAGKPEKKEDVPSPATDDGGKKQAEDKN